MSLMEKIGEYQTNWDLGKDVTYEILIANLGGYEAAKSKFRDNGSFHAERMRRLLLEYRRQHNIYEAGDLVVSRCNDNETRVFKYETTIGKNIVVRCKKGKSYCYPCKWFGHAKDEEIEAKKRLEVKA